MSNTIALSEVAGCIDELLELLDANILGGKSRFPMGYTLGETEIYACEVIVKHFGEMDTETGIQMPSEKSELLAFAAIAILRDRHRFSKVNPDGTTAEPLPALPTEPNALIGILELFTVSMRTRGFEKTREALLNPTQTA